MKTGWLIDAGILPWIIVWAFKIGKVKFCDRFKRK